MQEEPWSIRRALESAAAQARRRRATLRWGLALLLLCALILAALLGWTANP